VACCAGALVRAAPPAVGVRRPAALRAGQLGAVFRTVLETTRTLFVWLADLLLFYTPLGVGKLGESWSRYSYVQAVGCAAAPHTRGFHFSHLCSALLGSAPDPGRHHQ
jgi:hypothetical protein